MGGDSGAAGLRGSPGARDLPGQLDLDPDIRPRVGVRRIDDRDEVGAAFRAMITAGSRELLSALPAGPYRLEVLRSSWDQDVDMLRRGLRVYCVYQADAVRSAEILSYLTEFAAAGASVRVALRVSHRMMIVDRRGAALAVNGDTFKPPYLLIDEPAMVRQLFAQFHSLWRSAYSVGVGPEDSLAVDIVRDVVRVLADGLSDSAAARRLDVSERTLRRRVAAVLELLGASTRFEAGVKAAHYGWL